MSLLNRMVLEDLITSGFDLELIAFELDVPLEKLKIYKNELEKYGVIKVKKQNEKVDFSIISNKIRKIRRRYNSLYNNNMKDNYELPEATLEGNDISEEDIKQAEEIINTIRNLLESGNEKNSFEQRKIAKIVYAEGFKQIKFNRISFEQEQELYKLLQHDLLKNFARISSVDPLVREFLNIKNVVVRSLEKSIDARLKITNDLNGLEKLREIASIVDINDNKVVVSSMKGNIASKIRKVQNAKAISELKVVPESIVEIVNRMVDRSLNLDEAKKMIDDEVRKKCVDKKNEKHFVYTEESARKVINEQIHTLIKENAEMYSIENVEELIQTLSELTNKGTEISAKTVIANLSKRKEYQRAKVVCEIYKGEDKNSDTYKAFQSIKHGIERMEIGDIALDLIKGGTPEEEMEWFTKITTSNKKGINPDTCYHMMILENKWSDKKDPCCMISFM